MTENWEDGVGFDLPAHAPLPPDVRDRLRAGVLDRLDEHDRSSSRRMPIAVAATVVALAATGAVIAHNVDTGRAATAASQTDPSVNPVVAKADMDRCWSAIEKAGKSSAVPPRATWHVVLGRHNLDDQEVLGISGQGKVFFCDTTLTTVTVSDPSAATHYVAGSRTGALLVDPDGVIAGVVDPTWSKVVLRQETVTGAASFGPAVGSNGLFIQFGVFSTREDTTRFSVRGTYPGDPYGTVGLTYLGPYSRHLATSDRYPYAALPRPATPLVSTVDRPTGAADRSSVSGQLLGACLAGADSPEVDAQSWQPGAVVHLVGATAVAAYNTRSFAVCFTDQGSTTTPVDSFAPVPRKAAAADSPLLALMNATVNAPRQNNSQVSGPIVVAGRVSAAVAKVQLVYPDGSTVQATPTNSTFALAGNRPFEGPVFAPHASVLRLLDRHGKVIYQQSLN